MSIRSTRISHASIVNVANEETEDVNTQDYMYNTDNPETSIKIKLQKGLGVIRKRKQQAILRTRRYKVHTEPEKYYRAKLLLYYQWNHEDDIIQHTKVFKTHTLANSISYIKMHKNLM